MSDYDYDLFTIGAGSGGVRASRLAASYGAKVGVAEEYRVGGTCVIRGCVPKKYLVYASEYGHDFENAKGRNVICDFVAPTEISRVSFKPLTLLCSDRFVCL